MNNKLPLLRCQFNFFRSDTVREEAGCTPVTAETVFSTQQNTVVEVQAHTQQSTAATSVSVKEQSSHQLVSVNTDDIKQNSPADTATEAEQQYHCSPTDGDELANT